MNIEDIQAMVDANPITPEPLKTLVGVAMAAQAFVTAYDDTTKAGDAYYMPRAEALEGLRIALDKLKFKGPTT